MTSHAGKRNKMTPNLTSSRIKHESMHLNAYRKNKQLELSHTSYLLSFLSSSSSPRIIMKFSTSCLSLPIIEETWKRWRWKTERMSSLMKKWRKKVKDRDFLVSHFFISSSYLYLSLHLKSCVSVLLTSIFFILLDFPCPSLGFIHTFWWWVLSFDGEFWKKIEKKDNPILSVQSWVYIEIIME